MTLGSFQPKTRITGDKVDYATYLGRPLLVRVMDYAPEFSSAQYPEPKPVVFVDVVDLISGQIFINALWGSGAVVDNLKDYAGTEVALPVQLIQRKGKNTYYTLDALDAATTANAGLWYEANWGAVNAERARREAAANAAAAVAPAQQGFGAPAQAAPVQQAPAQGFGAPAQAAPVQQAPAQGFGAPAQAAPVQGFGAPAQAAPVQGFGAPQGGGMFSDTPPAQAPGQGFGAPQGVDPALAQQALQNLNGQLAQPQG